MDLQHASNLMSDVVIVVGAIVIGLAVGRLLASLRSSRKTEDQGDIWQ